MPRETKIAVCKELLASHFFSEVLQLVYNNSYEQKGYKFECERKHLWLVSREYVLTERFRDFQQMIMCPVCSKDSKTCFIVTSEEDVDREYFTKRTFNNDERNMKLSFKQLVDSRETFDFESREYLDANEKFITSQQTHYTDATQGLSSAPLSSSVEQYDSEQKADSRQRRNLRQWAKSGQQAYPKQQVGIPGVGRHTDSNRSNSRHRFNSGQRFDSSQQVIAEEAPDNGQDIDIDQLVHASHPSDVKPLNLYEVKLGQEVDKEISDVERTIDIEPQIQADHLNNPMIRVGSLPNVGPEEHIADERKIESLVHSPNGAEQSVSEQIVDKQETFAEVDQNTDIEDQVHHAHPNDAMKQSVSHQEVDLEQLDHAGQHRDAIEKGDTLKYVEPEQQVVGEITPTESEKDTDIDQHAGQPSDAGEKSEMVMKEAEQKVLIAKTALAEGNPETEQKQHSNAEEQLDSDQKVNLQQNENILEKVDSAEDDSRQYANPGEELEEYYFSIDPLQTQSIFLYTWFKRGGYFTIYMHIIELETPILRPAVTQPKVEEPFDMWKGPLHTRPIRPYEPYDFLDEIEENKVPRLVQSSNRLIEMNQFAGEN